MRVARAPVRVVDSGMARFGRMRYVMRVFPATALLLASVLPAAAAQPNILFVFSDDHAYQAISAYGSMINHTPNIDRIAREGMRFDRALVTNSICAPSRAVILTGKYSHLNGVLNNRLRFDGSQQTFPKLLQAAGYQTAIFGKWHLKTAPTGFDAWEVLPGQGAYFNPDMRVGPDDSSRRHEGYTTDIITDLSLEWLKEKRDPDRPFMLMSQHKAPHGTWMPGPEHLTLYDGQHIWEPPTLFDDYAGRASPAAKNRMEIGRHLISAHHLKINPPPDTPEDDGVLRQWMRTYGRLNPAQKAVWDAVYGPKNQAFLEANLQGKDLIRWKYQRYIKDYLRCVASVDDSVGRLLRYLDETGLAENTVVVYSSDQGFYLGEHGWYDKRWMYRESLRTPLVVRWPGVVAAGSTNRDLVSNLDYSETFLEIAGADVPPEMQGRSLVPILQGQTPRNWRKSFYYHYYESQVGHGVPAHEGVRTDRYKLIRYYESDEWELYDTELNPEETQSVYGQEGMEKVTADLKAELKRLQGMYGVTEPSL